MLRLRLPHFVAVLAASGLLFGIAGTAHAKLIGFHGTLSIGFAGLPPIVATGVGQAILNSSAGIGGHLVTLQILSNTVSITGVIVPITDPEVALTLSVRGTGALGTGILRPISGAAASGTGLTQNVLPIVGQLRICILFTGCPSSLPIPLTAANGRFFGTGGGPVGVGIGGLITIGTFGKGGARFSIYGQPWTVKTAIVTGVPIGGQLICDDSACTLIPPTGTSSPFVQGFAHGPVSATSSTAAIGGVVQLVTATRILSTFQFEIAPLFATLTIHLVPEPGTFLLFGSGIVALGFAGRRRRRKK